MPQKLTKILQLLQRKIKTNQGIFFQKLPNLKLKKDTNNYEAFQEINEEYNDSDDDGDWITPDNLRDEFIKDQNEQIQDTPIENKLINVALATGDFACQNVSIQLGINLLNTMSGKQIKRVRNYMYRCHACFRLTPINKDGKTKTFLSKMWWRYFVKMCCISR